MSREEHLKREADLIAANRQIESDLRARVMMPVVREAPSEAKVEMFHVGPVEPEPKRYQKIADQIDQRGMDEYKKRFPWTPPIVDKIRQRSVTLKEAAIRGNFTDFRALGGTFEEFKAIRDKLPRLGRG